MSGSDNYRILFYASSDELREMWSHMFRMVDDRTSFTVANDINSFYTRAGLEKYDAVIINTIGINLGSQNKEEQAIAKFIENGGYRGQKGDPAIFVFDRVEIKDFVTKFPDEVTLSAGKTPSEALKEVKNHLKHSQKQKSVA